MWEFKILGGFRSFNQGWSSSDPEYIGATDGVATMKWTHPGTLAHTLGSSFVIGYENRRDGDRDYQDIVIVATAPCRCRNRRRSRSSPPACWAWPA